MKRFIGAICAGAVFVSGAAAQNNQLSNQGSPVANPTQPLAEFNVQNIGAILSEMGVTWQEHAADNGQPYIDANFAGVVNFRLVPSACRSANFNNCSGLSLLSGFAGRANPQTVNAFNYRYAFASAGLDPSGSAYLSRYEISDYGMPRGNLATSILVFVQQTAFLADELASARQTVSLEGYADDLSASALNRQMRVGLGGAVKAPSNPVEMHQQGLEETAKNVRDFIADTSAPKNKIANIKK